MIQKLLKYSLLLRLKREKSLNTMSSEVQDDPQVTSNELELNDKLFANSEMEMSTTVKL